jgi:hypothetical protein
MKLLVTKGGANLEDRYGLCTVFFVCLYRGDYEMVKWMILEGGQDVNTRNVNNGDNPLIVVARRNNLEMVQWMVNVGKADISLINDKGFCPLFEHHTFGVAEWLMVNGHVDANMIVDNSPLFFKVARNLDMKLLRTLLDSGRADVHRVDLHGNSVWLAVNWKFSSERVERDKGQQFIEIVAPRLDPPEEVLSILTGRGSSTYLRDWLRSGMGLRKVLLQIRDRKEDEMKAFVPPNVLRSIIMEYDTMTTDEMWDAG